MSLIDFRVEAAFFHHHKTKSLRRACGEHGVLCLLQLWGHAATNVPDGNLTSMSDNAIEIAAGWDQPEDEPGKFVEQLRNSDSRFLDGKQLHDWQEHQPYLCGRKERSERAKNASRMRWASVEHARSNPKEQCPIPISISIPISSSISIPGEDPARDLVNPIVEQFNTRCRDLPPVKLIAPNSTRYKHLLTRIKEDKDRLDLTWWNALFDKIAASDYLCGKVKDWRATFDWIVKAENFIKILEGNYDRAGKQKFTHGPADYVPGYK